MANENLPVVQVPRSLDAIVSGGPTIQDVYAVDDGTGFYLPDATGPADAYPVNDGNDFFEPDSGAVATDASFFKLINGWAYIKP